MSKISTKWALSRIARKVCHPKNFFQLLGHMRGHTPTHRSKGDEQLELYSKILPGDYLHYGYFEEVPSSPEEISLQDIFNAQDAYAQLLVDQVKRTESRVLDIGCGLGGLLKLLESRSIEVQGITPDSSQIRYIRSRYPSIPLFEGVFEDYPIEENIGSYGSIITSESFQYLDFDRCFDSIEKLLEEKGRWILCDYFKRDGKASEDSGHLWEDFESKRSRDGWKVILEHDITDNVLPGLSFAHMWCQRMVFPLFQYAEKKLQRKRPAAHFVLEELVEEVENSLQGTFRLLDPETFRKEKRYILTVMEHP